jgi:stage V sporulation protein R
MQLIDQHTKSIMEGCKGRARDAGLRFGDETLEYIVTNRDLLELSPKMMIPTLYDYWVHEVEVLKEKGRYELYPGNPFETVINTRPAISFYNDNNPDWLNVMIFYHVLAHIDFFQNNIFFSHTWDYDLTGQALSDKRLIARLRSEKGRWLDYVIEFARSIDNLVGYFEEMGRADRPRETTRGSRLDFYFDVFLQGAKRFRTSEYIAEIERYNDCMRRYGSLGEQNFFADVVRKYPEFEASYGKNRQKPEGRRLDLLEYLMERSDFLNREENRWIKSVLQIVRKTSLYFQPQIRTKIMNEGWASYWHEKLFLEDKRINGHEVDFARVHAQVTSLPRVGLNPYALGMRLFSYIEDASGKGKLSSGFRRIRNSDLREKFDARTGEGKKTIFEVRRNHSDFTFINSFIDQDFVNRHQLFVAGKRMDRTRMVWEYIVESRKAEAYKAMLLNTLYHPPHIEIDPQRSGSGLLFLTHHFEGKPLVREYIENTMMGIEFLWGGTVMLETSEVAAVEPPGKLSAPPPASAEAEERGPRVAWRRVLYTMQNRKLSKAGVEK